MIPGRLCRSTSHICGVAQEREPFQYTVGSVIWHDLVLAVGPGVLIPRPETYNIKGFARNAIEECPRLAQLPWVDMGCGSGTTLLSLAPVLALKFVCCRLQNLLLSSCTFSFLTVTHIALSCVFQPRASASVLVPCTSLGVLIHGSWQLGRKWHAACHGPSCSPAAGALTCAIGHILTSTSMSNGEDRSQREEVEHETAGGVPAHVELSSATHKCGGHQPRVIAVDVCDIAVQYTRTNVRRQGLQDVVEVRRSCWGEALADMEGACGGVVSNPPYIPQHKLPYLQPEVSRFVISATSDDAEIVLGRCALFPSSTVRCRKWKDRAYIVAALHEFEVFCARWVQFGALALRDSTSVLNCLVLIFMALFGKRVRSRVVRRWLPARGRLRGLPVTIDMALAFLVIAIVSKVSPASASPVAQIRCSTLACVCRHEPWLALDGGRGDGLEAIHAVVDCACWLLMPGGFVAVEVRTGVSEVCSRRTVIVQPCMLVQALSDSSCRTCDCRCNQAQAPHLDKSHLLANTVCRAASCQP
jgi:methylase of polypeptide subunit release factors